jgi:uridine kinase
VTDHSPSEDGRLATAEEICDAIRSLKLRGRQTLLVAIDGCGGSGKSTLAAFLAKQLSAAVVHTDDFARPAVQGWEWERFTQHILMPLMNDRPARYQPYDWDNNRLGAWVDIPIGGLVIVEGVSSTRRELGDPWDLTIWVECPRELRLARGLARDGEAKRSMWVDVWMVEEDKYVADHSPQLRANLTYDGSRGLRAG